MSYWPMVLVIMFIDIVFIFLLFLKLNLYKHFHLDTKIQDDGSNRQLLTCIMWNTYLFSSVID